MKLKEFKEIFNDDNSDEFLEFEHIERPYSRFQDVHAFILLEVLLPRTIKGDMITASEHDQIYLAPDVKKIVKNMTREQAIDLRRCGVLYDEDTDSLFMFT